MLNFQLLLMTCVLNLSIMSLITSALWYFNPNIKSLKYFTLFGITFLIGQYLITFVNILPDFLTIFVGNNMIVLAQIFLYIAIRYFLKLESGWKNRYLIPLGIMLFGYYIFTFLYYDIRMRITIFSAFTALTTAVLFLLFWNNNLKKFKFLNKFSKIIFFIGFILFMIRTFRALTIEMSANYLKTVDFWIILPYIYLIFISIWVLYIISLEINFKQMFINKK